MLIRHSVILTGSLLEIIGTASNLGPDRDDIEGVEIGKASRVRELIESDSREKTIKNLEECIPPEWQVIPIKGSEDGIEYSGDGTIEVDATYYSLLLSEHWYMWDLREMARASLGGPVIEFKLDSEECQKRVDFHNTNPQAVFKRWEQRVKHKEEVVNLLSRDVPELLRLIREFHEMGLLVDFDHVNSVDFFRTDGMEFRLELDPAFELGMVTRHQRAEDMRKLARALEVSMNLGLVVIGFNEKLAQLTTGLSEVPDYDAWIESLSSGVEFYDAATILRRAVEIGFENQFVICRWIPLILDEFDAHPRRCSLTNIDEQWECLLGPELVALVRITRGDHECQSLLAEWVVERVQRVHKLTGSIVRFALWLHAQLGEWEDMDLCSALDGLEHIMFYYVVCPRQHFWVQEGYTRQTASLKPKVMNVATKEEVEKLWPLLGFPEFAVEFKDKPQAIEHAFVVANFLFQTAAHLENIEAMCESYSEVLTKMVTRSRSFIRLATSCGLWDNEAALEEFLTSRIRSLKPDWEEGSCEYFAGRLISITEQPYRLLLHSYVLRCALESWRSPKENSNPVGLRDFAKSLPGLTGSQVCSETLMAEYVADEAVLESLRVEALWMCGRKIRRDIVCRLGNEPLKYLISDYSRKAVDYSVFFAEFKSTKMLAAIDECSAGERFAVMHLMVGTLRDIQRTYGLSDSELAAKVSDTDPHFCDHNSDVLGQLRFQNAEFARKICPNTPFAKQFARKEMLARIVMTWAWTPGATGLRSFAESFPALAESNICEPEELDGYVEYSVQTGEAESLTESLWVCGKELPAKAACRPGEKLGRTFASLYHAKGVDVAEFLSDLEATGILSVIDQCSAQEQNGAVGSVINLFREIQRIYQLTDIQLRAALVGRETLEYFCRFNQNVLQTRPADEFHLITSFCPHIPRSLEAIRLIVDSVPRPIRSKVLRVRRAHPFTDAFELLTDKFVEADVPSGVVFDDEVAPSPMHDWLRLAGQEAASLLIAQDGTQIQPNAPQQQYYAFGRLIAIAAMREGTLGMRFPENFFQEVLTRRRDDDQSPISPIDIIREGLEYFYPVPRILDQLTPEEFGIMFT